MLGGVVHNPDPRIGQYLLQGIAHSHHIFVVIGIPPGVPRVVGFAVIRLIAFGSMGVEDQDLRRVGPLEGEVHPLLHDLYDLTVRLVGIVAQFASAIPQQVFRGAGHILLQ